VRTNTNVLNAKIDRILKTRKQSGRFRKRTILCSPQGAEIRCGSNKLLNFCSNDYLGFANHPEIIDALKQGVDKYGVGSGASHLVCGHNEAHRKLEERLADFTGRQRALLFSTGYMANLAIISALLGRKDEVYADRLNHASMIDAACLSSAQLKRYPHCDDKQLEIALGNSEAKIKMVVTDGVFSMDGDIAPIPDLSVACHKNGAILAVDDAHGFGVMGRTGGGTLEHFNCSAGDVPLLMATFGKALGVFGAFIAGDEDVIETIMQTARPYIYTTAPPPALAVATLKALDLLAEEQWRRQHLSELIEYFKKGAFKENIPVGESHTPIQPLIIGSDKKTVEISRALYKCGILISAIRPPTVPENTARLRITLTAAHTMDQVDRLLEALALILKE